MMVVLDGLLLVLLMLSCSISGALVWQMRADQAATRRLVYQLARSERTVASLRQQRRRRGPVCTPPQLRDLVPPMLGPPAPARRGTLSVTGHVVDLPHWAAHTAEVPAAALASPPVPYGPFMDSYGSAR